jgi:hypothetical protein
VDFVILLIFSSKVGHGCRRERVFRFLQNMAYFTETPPLCQAILLVIIEIKQLNDIAINGFIYCLSPWMFLLELSWRV